MDKQLETRDVVSWLVEAYEKSDPANQEEELQWLSGDSRLIIIAGRQVPTFEPTEKRRTDRISATLHQPH